MKRLRQWPAAISKRDIKLPNVKHTRVYSVHFISGRPSALYDRTNPDRVPTLSLGHSESHSCDTSTSRYDKLRKERRSDASWSLTQIRQAKERKAKRCKLELDEAMNSGHTEQHDEKPAVEGLEDATSSSTLISVQTMLEQDGIVRLQHEVSCLKSKLAEVTLS